MRSMVGYHANASKTWLVVKPDHFDEAKSVFGDTEVKIACEGRPYLGTALGSHSYTSEFVKGKVDQWIRELKLLSNIAASQPHAAFAAGLMSKWAYISRTTPNISNLLRSLEDVIRHVFIPSITRRPPPNDHVRNLMGLPARLGGMGILDPSSRSDDKFNASSKVTAPLIHLMEQSCGELTYQVFVDQISAKRDIQHERRENSAQTYVRKYPMLSWTLQTNQGLLAG